MLLGYIDGERRLIDPLVGHPRPQHPDRDVRPERVAQRVPPLVWETNSAADPEDHRVRLPVGLAAAVRVPLVVIAQLLT